MNGPGAESVPPRGDVARLGGDLAPPGLPASGLTLLDPSDELIRDTVEMSQRFGRDPEYSRGGGGNSSLKAGGVVYIKPSGVPLATLEAEDLVPLATAPLLDLLLHGGSEADEARLPDAAPTRSCAPRPGCAWPRPEGGAHRWS